MRLITSTILAQQMKTEVKIAARHTDDLRDRRKPIRKKAIHYELVTNHSNGYIRQSIQFRDFKSANEFRKSDTNYWYCQIVKVTTLYKTLPQYKS
jgi:hypothetical protein